MFKTNGTIDKEFLEGLGCTMMEKWRDRGMIVGAIACLAFAVVCLVFSFWLPAIIGAIGFCVFLWERMIIENTTIRNTLRNLEKTTGSASLKASTKFTDEGFVVMSDGYEPTVIKYEELKSIRESSHAYVIKATNGMTSFVFKDGLKPEDQQKLIDFLKSKPTKIKWGKK